MWLSPFRLILECFAGNLSGKFASKATMVVEIKAMPLVDMTRDMESLITVLVVVNDLVNTCEGIVDDHDHDHNPVVAIGDRGVIVTAVPTKIVMAIVIRAPPVPEKEECYS